MELSMHLKWYTTVSKTRVLYDGKDRVGHFRNSGKTEWYCEVYPVNKSVTLESLSAAKNWVYDTYINWKGTRLFDK
jgi:hypothetical protein